jgi:uncharacterized protein (TIGR00369 family)
MRVRGDDHQGGRALRLAAIAFWPVSTKPRATSESSDPDKSEPSDSENLAAGKAGRPGIDGVSGFMGMHWDSADTVRLEIRPELINAAGLLSGVVTYALIDYCMGSTLWVETSEEEHIATINIAINYIQTAVQGEIVCKCTLDRRNRSNAVLRGEVRHEDDRLLVTAVGSYAIFPARKRSRVPGA